MCSYSESTGASVCSDSWEEEPWTNVLSPGQGNSSNIEYQVNSISAANECQISTWISGNPVSERAIDQDLSALLSPTWDQSSSPTQQTIYTNMSSYFSNFNPQIQEVSFQQHSAMKFNNTKVHQARISFVPKNGAYKTIVKRKRKRTIFTTEQIEALEEVFAKRPYVTREERQILVERLQVNDKSVKIWFQNRRLKNKRGSDEHDVEEDNSKIFERLDAIESKMFEKVDAFGYVTLDDKVMSELVNVIDDYFASKVSAVKPKKETYDSPIYEPISPASSDDNCDVATSWSDSYHGPVNDKFTQDLMDIESIISM